MTINLFIFAITLHYSMVLHTSTLKDIPFYPFSPTPPKAKRPNRSKIELGENGVHFIPPSHPSAKWTNLTQKILLIVQGFASQMSFLRKTNNIK